MSLARSLSPDKKSEGEFLHYMEVALVNSITNSYWPKMFELKAVDYLTGPGCTLNFDKVQAEGGVVS